MKTLARPDSIFADMLIIDPKEAFDQAIKEGRLSEDPAALNYSGDFMYMGSRMLTRWWGKKYRQDDFKHRDFRDYLPDRPPLFRALRLIPWRLQ